jgi:hypothetical protein
LTPARSKTTDEASRTVVNIWDVLARSENSLMVEEIATELSRRGLRDNTDAVMFHKQEMAAKLDPAAAKAFEALWANESPPADFLEEAWLAYVTHWLRAGSDKNAFVVTTDEGTDPRSSKAIKRYSANRQKPPMVYRWFVTSERRLVPYDPDQRDQANQGHTAGIEFLRRFAELDSKRKVPADLRELLDLAERAIRARTGEDPE